MNTPTWTLRLGLFLLLPILACGCGTPSFLITPVSGSTELKEKVVEEGKGWSPRKIVLIEVEGMLINARTGGFLQPAENDLSLFKQQLEKAEKDSAVAAIVLRINSPGGTVATTDTMYELVQRYKAKTKKPVIASAQEVMASGGYYVACAADRIVAHPTSVVGSIGVLFNTFDFSGTLGKIGARSEVIKSGPMKDMGSPLRPLTDPERLVMQGIVNEYHDRFVGVVKANRKSMDEAAMRQVARGRVFSGQEAVKLGLADAAGLLEDAIALAREVAKAPGAQVVLYRRPYGYSGSIYATEPTPQPQANVIQVNLPPTRALMPSGFYYLWEP